MPSREPARNEVNMRIQDIPDLEIIDLDHEAFSEENTKKGRPKKADIDHRDLEDTDMDQSGFEDADMDQDGLEDTDMDQDDLEDADMDQDDLEDTDMDDSASEDEEMDDDGDPEESGPPKKFPLNINIHIVLLVVVVVTISFILYKYLSWGQIVDPEETPSGPDDYVAQSYDSILPLTDSEGNMVAPNLDDGLSIAIFGNGPFAEDRDSADGLANMLADAAGATVYNCSISGSYLASTQPAPDMTVNPWDAFTFYWMSLFSTDLEVNDYFAEAMSALGAEAPPEAAQVHDILSTLDFDTIDVIVVMYDAADYFAGRPAYSTETIPDIQSFAGNLKVGLEILKQQHPNTRIIVMSPAYAFSDQTDENGSYISSDIVRYGEDVLSTYVSKASEITGALQVSFVDNFYVTFNEDNAADYLSDHAHLNVDGRKKVIDRLLYALNYYDLFFEE